MPDSLSHSEALAIARPIANNPTFDTDIPEQRERTLFLISRFMVWKMATSFVLTAETWLGAEKTRHGDEALLAVGVSRHERLGVLQRIQRGDVVGFSEPM